MFRKHLTNNRYPLALSVCTRLSTARAPRGRLSPNHLVYSSCLQCSSPSISYHLACICMILEHFHLDELNFHQELISRFLKSRSVSSVYSHTTLTRSNFIRSVSYASFKISSSQHNYFFILMILHSVSSWKSAVIIGYLHFQS